MSFSFPFLFPPRLTQNTGRGAERISNSEPTLVPMGANREEGKTVLSCRREIAVSVFFRVLGASCGQRRNNSAWTSPGTQVPRHPGPRGSSCTWDASKLQASGPTCAKVRKVQGAMSLPQGLLSLPHCLPASESALQVLPGRFHATNQRPGSHAPSPGRLHPPPDPTTRFGREDLLYGVLRGLAGLQQERLQVCDSSPPGSKSQGRCDFHITLQISPRPALFLDLVPPSLPHTFQILSLPKGQHTLSE